MTNPWVTARVALFGVAASLSLPAAGIAQETITEIPFDSIPANTTLLAETITLSGDTVVTGTVVGASLIEAQQGGFKFPDGTVQTYAPLLDMDIGCDVIPCRWSVFRKILQDPTNPWQTSWSSAKRVYGQPA